ncbi:protein phosphatase regulator [Verticillium dahliae]
MPYTPPSHSRSPANSAPSSPDVSRRPSFQSSPRPSLPRSASYLTKNRRSTPSALGGGNGATNDKVPVGATDNVKTLATTSVRQSPPPVTNESGMPNGAVISPPDSASEDEEGTQRGRQLHNLKELQDAISQIPVRRAPSPPPKTAAVEISRPEVISSNNIVHSFSTPDLAGGRRRTHTRSATEPKVMISKSSETSLTGSEEESDEDLMMKPPMVRKKSGELVRPALRPSSHRRPSSMPGTPTFSKAVHFDSHLEHVRHFLQVDRPLAVSAGSSPADNYDSDNEYPFPGDERSGTRSPPYEWEIVTANQPMDSPIRKSLPVRLEKVWLSPDQKSLLGSVAVENLSFQKSVTCRFTLDYWKTTSEVAAEYSHEIRPKESDAGHDRFTFAIKLSDLAHLESKTLYFCVRYNVMGQEFWDNNGGTNFQVDFRKKHLPQNGKRVIGAASRPVGGLPRSNRRASPAASSSRPKSVNVGFDDFGGEKGKYNFDQPIHEYLGESGPPLRLKTKSTGNLASDNISRGLTAPSGQAFSNRYDFGASLTAAVQAAKDSMSKDTKADGGLYMKSHKKISMAHEPPKLKMPVVPRGPSPMISNPKPVAVAGNDSPNTSLASNSYEELVNKYCFFGSKQSSPNLQEGTLKGSKYDGAGDACDTRGTNSTNSSQNGSPNMPHHAGAAQHHSLHIRDDSPYFFGGAVGASPANSPLISLIPSSERPASPSTAQRQAGQGATPASASPAPMTGGLPQFAGTSPHLYAQHLPERFPFSFSETHAGTAIRG